jgi:hypothetical protein
MIYKCTQRVTKDTKGTKDHTVPQSYIKPYPTIPFPIHTLYSREDLRPFVTASSSIMIVVHFAKVSALYPRVVISSPIGDLRTFFVPLFTLPLVYDLEITTCRYKGLLQKYVMLSYSFLNKRSPHAVLRFLAQMSPLALCGSGRSQSMSHVWHKEWCPSPLIRARHTTYNIPN